jgi:hypothetical protein
MSREALEEILRRWESDPNFRQSLRADPTGTVQRAGIALDPDEMEALRNVPWDLSDDELAARARDRDKGHQLGQW